MATNAPITGVPTRAPFNPPGSLTRFETVSDQPALLATALDISTGGPEHGA